MSKRGYVQVKLSAEVMQKLAALLTRLEKAPGPKWTMSTLVGRLAELGMDGVMRGTSNGRNGEDGPGDAEIIRWLMATANGGGR